MENFISKADVLMEALPYFRRFYGKTFVIKYGGHAMIDEDLKESFAQDIVLLKYVGINPVVVHGGGPQIDEVLDKMGITSRYVRGMRVTDQDDDWTSSRWFLWAKSIKRLSLSINQHGGMAVGLSGKDGGLILARKMNVTVSDNGEPPEIVDIGMVGEIVGINPLVIDSLDENKFIPVIAPVGVGVKGETYNINADLVAGEVAEALHAEKLILMTDVEAVKDKKGELLSTLKVNQARKIDPGRRRWLAGMIPKVECCINALKGGVEKTHIIDGRVKHAVLLEIFTKEGVGTEVVRK